MTKTDVMNEIERLKQKARDTAISVMEDEQSDDDDFVYNACVYRLTTELLEHFEKLVRELDDDN